MACRSCAVAQAGTGEREGEGGTEWEIWRNKQNVHVQVPVRPAAPTITLKFAIPEAPALKGMCAKLGGVQKQSDTKCAPRAPWALRPEPATGAQKCRAWPNRR
jgi:hypothetical protein